jgi:hypothetical protein
MNKRDIYNGVVAEVESDKALIEIEKPTSYTDMVKEEGMSMVLPCEGVFLKSATSAFADYAVRDAILIKAMEDEDFAFVLINKIGATVKKKVEEDEAVTQDDIEALATAGQVLTMWEQFDSAFSMTLLLDKAVEFNSLTEPTLTSLTKRLLGAKESFPFKATREGAIRDLAGKAQEGLDNE